MNWGPERLLCEGTKPGPGGNGPLLLTPLKLLNRLAALVPPIEGDVLNEALGVLALGGTPTDFPSLRCTSPSSIRAPSPASLRVGTRSG